MMKKCPRCKQYTVAYDGYKNVERCMVVGCGCIVIDNKSYSYLRRDNITHTMTRILVKIGTEQEEDIYELT